MNLNHLLPQPRNYKGEIMANFMKLQVLSPYMLKKIPFFKEMESKDLEILSEKMQILNVNEGDLIISEGDESKTIYFILEGAVTVFRVNHKDQKEYIYEINAPSYFGEMAIMDGGPRSASVRAKTNTVLAELRWDDVRYLFEDRPEIMCYIFKNIGNVISIRLRIKNSINSCLA